MSVTFPLVYWGVADLSRRSADATAVFSDLVAGLAALVLLAGLWTPVAAAGIALDQLWIAFSPTLVPQGEHGIHILFAALSVSVAMLGPGAWSIDARRFGRKVFDVGDRSRALNGPLNRGQSGDV